MGYYFMSNEGNNNVSCTIRVSTPFGQYIVASGLGQREANDLIKELEQKAKQDGSYFEDMFSLSYTRIR